jgi:hypothetical protein
VNQYSPFEFVLERLLLAAGPKIFLQQYRARSELLHRSKRASLNVTGTHVSVSADRASRLLPSLTASRQSIRAVDLYQGAVA